MMSYEKMMSYENYFEFLEENIEIWVQSIFIDIEKYHQQLVTSIDKLEGMLLEASNNFITCRNSKSAICRNFKNYLINKRLFKFLWGIIIK